NISHLATHAEKALHAYEQAGTKAERKLARNQLRKAKKNLRLEGYEDLADKLTETRRSQKALRKMTREQPAFDKLKTSFQKTKFQNPNYFENAKHYLQNNDFASLENHLYANPAIKDAEKALKSGTLKQHLDQHAGYLPKHVKTYHELLNA